MRYMWGYWCAFVLCCVPGTDLSARPQETYQSPQQVEMLLRAQAYLFNDRYRDADALYETYLTTWPEDPAGYLYRAAGLMAEMSDLEAPVHSELFKGLLNSVDAITARRLQDCDSNTAAWMHLYRGHVIAYRALWESKFGSFFTAVKLGLKANDDYEAGLGFDSTLLDLYAGLGSYHYWKSAKAGMLSWVGIFKNEKELGIEELRRAADSSVLHREAARSALIWVHFDAEQYDSAIAIAQEFVAKYPEGKTFRWPLAQAYFDSRAFHQAREAYDTLRTMLLKAPGNYYNVIECDYYIAQCYSWLSMPDEASTSARRFMTYWSAIPRETVSRQGQKVVYLQRVAKR